ncbi:MAG: nicotinate-nucleotide adenylyltransferase [Chloroflexi bacterium]|nr:nicotinate-nucleotide adenylyltransferase [Chloroflexota bacterium]MDA8187445.1 nicotinate-nucleotide adenylyltransferase [Dehalococcoidales bacterium]
MKVGVLGGSFDPVHYGHLVAAEEVRFRLQLGEVIFVPAGQPPHKLFRAVSPAEGRLEMVNLAIASNSHFRSSRVDIDRPGPHYSVDTVALLRKELGREAEIYFIVGLDSLLEMGSWREPAKLLRMCRVVGVTRPGYEDLSQLAPEMRRAGGDRITIVPIPQIGISSSSLRQRVKEGAPIRYQVPEVVEEYIYRHGLYG